MVDSGQSLLYKATCTEVQLHPDRSIFSPNPERTPEYYRNQKYWAWFKFTKIEECSETQLKQYSYVDFPELFNDANIDYSKFNNKVVYSIPELTQQNRTVWFIRQSNATDSDNEIVLLNSEYIQPTHFSRRYWQASGDTLLWLSDLHLSDERFPMTNGPHKSLARHIAENVQGYNIAGVLVSGDITSRAETIGFEYAKQLFNELSSEVCSRITADNILMCPGNHDFVRENTELEPGHDPAFIYERPDNSKDFSDFYKSIYKIKPNQYFVTGRKILLSSGHELEIVALNSVILQQYIHFEGHGYLSQDQLDFAAREMGWNTSTNQKAIRIVMMHHHYLPTCLTENIGIAHASSAIYDANLLMNWLIKNNVKLLLHGHKHKTFVAQVNQAKEPESPNIDTKNMRCVSVVGMGGTGSPEGPNRLATLQFNNDEVIVKFYSISSEGSEQDRLIQTISLPLL